MKFDRLVHLMYQPVKYFIRCREWRGGERAYHPRLLLLRMYV